MTETILDATEVARRANASSYKLAVLDCDVKNRCLLDLAGRIEANEDRITEANDRDVIAAEEAGLSQVKVQRLILSDEGYRQMVDGLRQVASLPDPVGDVTVERRVPSGLLVRKVRCPLGVVLMIYEARPNVTVDAFSLCFKAGNACILKGGKEAIRTNTVLAELIGESLTHLELPADIVSLISTSDREFIKELLQKEEWIDLVIPRGSTGLIRFVSENSRIPTIQHFHGVCHIYVDRSAVLRQALEICTSAKTSSPAACNAVETILVHKAIAGEFVPEVVEKFGSCGVEVRGDATSRRLAPDCVEAIEEDWGREYLDLIVSLKVVEDLSQAIHHIHTYGSNHTDAILSEDPASQRTFASEVHSSCTLINASTRFNDGFQLGLGAEIGISTSRIHAYGPMGLAELTSQRYVVEGNGQLR